MLHPVSRTLCVFSLALVSPLVVAATCVTPKAKVLPNGNLDRQFISIYFKPAPASGIFLKVAAPVGLEVVNENASWFEVAGAPNSPFKNGEVLGWVRKSEVSQQAWRNCS